MNINSDHNQFLRKQMVSSQLRNRDIRDERVLAVMEEIPRHIFIPAEFQSEAYSDMPITIGYGQTISQPYIVALMTQCLDLQPSHEVFEIGTGCGYQTAILAKLVSHVYSIERIADLLYPAQKTLLQLNITNVDFHLGDGSKGWPDDRTFDRILVAAATDKTPEKLLNQLAPGGRMVIPVGHFTDQKLLLIEQQNNTFKETLLCYCRFVPLVKDND